MDRALAHANGVPDDVIDALAAVEAVPGIRLVNEPVLVGCSL